MKNDLVVVQFYDVPAGTFCRYKKQWVQRLGQNQAASTWGFPFYISGETLVGLRKKHLPKNAVVINIPQDLIDLVKLKK